VTAVTTTPPPPANTGPAISPEEPASTGRQAGLVARPAGVGRSGRDRRHEFPRRPRHVTAAFTDVEYAALVEAARRVGLTPTGFCAQAALAATTAPRSASHAGAVSTAVGAGVGASGAIAGGADPRVEMLAQVQAKLATLRTAIVRVGTNLNQAVAALHSRGEAPVWLRHVAEQCAAVLRTIDATATALHRRLRT
jgi:hypothetical protein